MIQQQKSTPTAQISASLHPDTGNLRLSVWGPKAGWSHYFFDGPSEAVDFLEQALELVDPADADGGADND